MVDDSPEISIITLRALEGTPLMHEPIRRMVIAASHALAEREGVTLAHVEADDSSVTFRLATDRLTALAFVAELRRLTTLWYTRKFGVPTLWGEAS